MRSSQGASPAATAITAAPRRAAWRAGARAGLLPSVRAIEPILNALFGPHRGGEKHPERIALRDA